MQDRYNINYAKQHHTPHCWLPAKVMYPANSTERFSWLTRSTSIFLMKNIQIYMLNLKYWSLSMDSAQNAHVVNTSAYFALFFVLGALFIFTSDILYGKEFVFLYCWHVNISTYFVHHN